MRQIILTICTFFLMSFYCLRGYAQEIKPLGIADTLPLVNLKIGAKLPYFKQTKEFRNKYLILDFWGTWCAPCVFSLHKMDSLQRLHYSNLNVLLVTQESAVTVNSFLEKYNKTATLSLSSVVEDTVLNALFPHTTVPHYVWIDNKGIIRYITYPEAVTYKNVTTFVEGRSLAVQQYAVADIPADSLDGRASDVAASTFLGDKLDKDSSLLSFRILTSFIPGHSGGGSTRDNHVYLYNMSITGLFALAYGKGSLRYFGGWSRIRLITDDSTKFTDQSGIGAENTAYRMLWRTLPGHEFNYFLKLPPGDSGDKYAICLQDLKANFPLVKAYVDTVKKLSLVLERTKGPSIFERTDTSKPVFERNAFYLTCNNVPFSNFMLALRLSFQGFDMPLVDSVGYIGKIRFQYEGDVTDLDKLNITLNRYGLRLVKKNVPTDILVLEDLAYTRRRQNSDTGGTK